MAAIRPENLPIPPPGRSGWPWIGQLTATPQRMNWPKITVITPSFNQGQYIEETIRSVLLQGYPNLEYWIMDGGSTDGSVEIIRKYSPWLAGWVSEPDRGQAHAINKGLKVATGKLVGWINSDDLLMPDALLALGTAHLALPQALLLGDVVNFSARSGRQKLVKASHVSFESMILPAASGAVWHQPGVYVPMELVQRVGELDESLRYLFDQDWMCRLLQQAPVHYLDKTVAKFRIHAQSKTLAERFHWQAEMELVARRYLNQAPGSDSPRVEAYLLLSRAATYLGKTRYDRQMGWHLTRQALRTDPRMICHPLSVELVLRCIFPYRLLIWAKFHIEHGREE